MQTSCWPPRKNPAQPKKIVAQALPQSMNRMYGHGVGNSFEEVMKRRTYSLTEEVARLLTREAIEEDLTGNIRVAQVLILSILVEQKFIEVLLYK